MIYVGTAGWSVPRTAAERFPGPGSHLQRYARLLRCAEINSTFKHVHRQSTYARWAESTPEAFRFSVKVPHAITHAQRLVNPESALAAFFDDVQALGTRLGPVLVQLPASQEFVAPVADAFFTALRRRHAGSVVCEPRHPGWFTADALSVMERFRVARVAADPARVEGADRPGGWRDSTDAGGLAYFRWHGSPQIYRSSYASERLDEFAKQVREAAVEGECWCVFDNTSAGAAAHNALELAERLGVGQADPGLSSVQA